MPTVFANLLENLHDEAKIADVEGGEREANVTKMSCTVAQGFLTCRTRAIFARGAETRVERSMTIGCAVVLDVVQQSIRYFEDGLIGDILI